LSKDGGPKDAGEAAERQRQGLSQARKTNFMRLDDAEDEAGHLCQRLVYIEKKLRLLLAALTAELARH
jgi:hypothetical protein